VNANSSSQASIHLIFGFIHGEYGRATSVSTIASTIKHKFYSQDTDDFPVPPIVPNDQVYSDRRENATFVILCKNNQIWDAVRSIRDIEDRFNYKYHYAYVFLNEVSFSEEFKVWV